LSGVLEGVGICFKKCGLSDYSKCSVPCAAITTFVPIVGVACPVDYPVQYLGNTYNNADDLLEAIQGVHSGFTIVWSGTATPCGFDFTGSGTPPSFVTLNEPRNGRMPPVEVSRVCSIGPINGGHVQTICVQADPADPMGAWPRSTVVEVYEHGTTNWITNGVASESGIACFELIGITAQFKIDIKVKNC
jgi:hypothetical protein